MYRFFTWAVGVLALATVLGAVGYDLSTEHVAAAHATTAGSASVRPAGEISNEGVERLLVIPLQPNDPGRRPVHANESGPAIVPVREELGAAVSLRGPAQVYSEGAASGAWVELPPEVVNRLAGGLARITVWARADRNSPSKEFAMALSIDGGFGGWVRFPLSAANYESYNFMAPVPESARGKTVRVLIAPDTSGGSHALSASHLIVDRILRPSETATEPVPAN
ncbi:hypothetical protein [Zavarzinia sp.]|uniref:hypothetical protein n=1 Tax=Zavarzinia sp. TaxID=2027920 RepID=UPI00356A10EA